MYVGLSLTGITLLMSNDQNGATSLLVLRRGRPRSGGGTSATHAYPERELAAAGTLTRTKALLLAALRVWELKNRISD